MKIKVLERDENFIRFLVSGIDVSLVNSLRRIMMTEVPSMEIDNVIMIENSSTMKDEVLALRLGLIPLKTDLDAYVLPKNCTCNSELGCSRCSVTLTLESEAQEGTRTVYSKELISIDPEIIPVSDKIPIVKLAQGQKVRFEAYAKLGLGLDHVKWQPTSRCTHKYAADIQVDHEKCTLCKKCLDACLKQVLAIKGQVNVIGLEKCNLCKQCEKICPIDAIRVEKIKDSFIFNVESMGGLPPERIFLESIKILKEKTDELKGFVTQIKAGKAE
ncbi:MAG: DNA-directed RNA polymerase subunit D [Candidatus Bathyarchaeia archaeon]